MTDARSKIQQKLPHLITHLSAHCIIRDSLANVSGYIAIFHTNYYYNDIKNQYDQNDASNYIIQDTYNEYKNHTLFNVEGKYSLSSQISMNLGYSNAWRMYGSESSHGRGFLDYREYRNKVFAYMKFSPSTKIQTKFGAAIEHISSYDRDIKSNYTRFLPYIQANISINKKHKHKCQLFN
mgnify:CR=1 FL=1